MPTRTKVICTIGPAVNSIENMIKLIDAGMNVARVNFSHGSHGEHEKAILNLKEARRLLKVPLAIMLDTKGPEIRVGIIDGGHVVLEAGHHWLLTGKEIVGDLTQVAINPGFVLNDLPVGAKILFDDGYICSHVVKRVPEGIIVEIENGGIIKSRKGVNIPNHSLSLPAITETDIADIRFGCQQDIDIIAASFVRSPDHVLTIKKLLDQEKKPGILVFAKIENCEGVQNFDSILRMADGIMIARGDLGVEVPLSQVPSLQKMMIRKSYLAGKSVVTATQMLESMIHNPRPTRAEASDVANAIYDGTSAVMLSGETAVGKYPLETVRVMRSIIEEAEKDFNYRAFFDQHASLIYHDVPSALTLAAVKTAYSSNAKAIFAFTSGGTTARLVSRLRPAMPIVAMTHKEKCFHQMAIDWGIVPHLSTHSDTISEAFAKISAFSLEAKIVINGDLVVVTAGSPFGISGTTNMMIVESIGDVLVRAHKGIGDRVHGNVVIVVSPDSTKPYNVRDQLVVLGKCDDTYLSLIKESAGVILQNNIEDIDSEEYLTQVGRDFSKPYVVRADAASQVLKEGQLVTLDPERALVYKGVVL